VPRVKAVSINGYPIYPSRPGRFKAALARPPVPRAFTTKAGRPVENEKEERTW